MHSAYRREELMIYESVSVAHLSGGDHFFARLPQGKIQPSVPWGGLPYSGLWYGGMRPTA